MKYEYQFVGGDLHGKRFTEEDMAEVGNGKFSLDLTPLRDKGITVHRKELDNQPLVDGYLSPMWNGSNADGTVGYIRYETQKMYDLLSN